MSAHPEQRRGGSVLWTVGILMLFLLAMLVGALVGMGVFGGDKDDFASAGSALADYIIPALFGTAVTVTVLSRRHWWPQALRDPVPARTWVWVVPAILTAGALVTTDWGRVGGAGAGLVLWLVLAAMAVAVSEELFFRGVVLTGLRGGFGEPVAAGLTVVVFALAHSLASLELNPLQIGHRGRGCRLLPHQAGLGLDPARHPDPRAQRLRPVQHLAGTGRERGQPRSLHLPGCGSRVPGGPGRRQVGRTEGVEDGRRGARGRVTVLGAQELAQPAC